MATKQTNDERGRKRRKKKKNRSSIGAFLFLAFTVVLFLLVVFPMSKKHTNETTEAATTAGTTASQTMITEPSSTKQETEATTETPTETESETPTATTEVPTESETETPPASTEPERVYVVVLDPGHGGADPGAMYFDRMEKEMTLKVAYACKEYLENNFSNVVVYMTRMGDAKFDDIDKKYDLQCRVDFAEQHGADIMVSLHFNSHFYHNKDGCTAIISKQPNINAESEKLANCIMDNLMALGLGTQGILTDNSDEYFDANGNSLDGYAINRNSAAIGLVGIIIENCYMDNEIDTPYLDSDADLAQLGYANALGIATYLGLTWR